MRKYISRLVQLQDRGVMKNFLALGLVQATNFLLPLISLPYLIRVVGLEKFGAISFVLALMSYLMVLTEYGFDITATKLASSHRHNRDALSRILGDVLATKFFLCLLSLAIMAVLVEGVPHFREYRVLFYMSFLLIVGQVFIPNWFFQGIERMEYLTYINLISRTVFVLLIFVCIREESHYIYVPFIYGLRNTVPGLIGFYFIRFKFGVKIRLAHVRNIPYQIREGGPIFFSSLLVTIFMYSNILILSFFADKQTLGFYSAAEKIVMVVRQLVLVFFQATYPTACQIGINSHTALRGFFKRLHVPFSLMALLGAIVIALFSSPLIWLISGEEAPYAGQILLILAFVPFAASLNIPANQTLLIYNFKREYTRVYSMGAVLYLFLGLMLTYYFSGVGTAWAILITELFISVSLYGVLELRKPHHSLLRKFSD